MRPTSEKRTFKRFLINDRGNFALMFAITAPVLLMAAGFGINTVQLTGSKSQLSASLDAALTSTARDITTGIIKIADAEDAAKAFLEANAEGGFMQNGTQHFTSFVVDKTSNTITASASANVKLAFPFFTSAAVQTIQASSGTVYSDKAIEVSMMLDITGSMAGQKLKDLKSAAKNAVTTFLAGSLPGSGRVRIAVVPYANAVNTGALAGNVHVETKYTAVTEEPPSISDPLAVGWHPDNCATERKGSQRFTDAGPQTAKVNRDVRTGYCPNAPVVPLTEDKAALNAAIDSFSANGSTAGHIGVQWSWYMLSPKWKNALPAGSAPGAYNNKKVAKYAILMTDGEFNTAYAGVANGANVTNQATRSRNDAEQLCAEMKKKGIEVFTIGFQLKAASAKGVMKKCASSDTGGIQHYFDTGSGAELDAAFQEIARNVERLAITR